MLPLNKQSLWKSAIEQANYPAPMQKLPMVLPKINTHIGGHVIEVPSIHDQMNANYQKYSAAYWQGVKRRQQLYRQNAQIDSEPVFIGYTKK
jgi:hypothetical protein